MTSSTDSTSNYSIDSVSDMPTLNTAEARKLTLFMRAKGVKSFQYQGFTVEFFDNVLVRKPKEETPLTDDELQRIEKARIDSLVYGSSL